MAMVHGCGGGGGYGVALRDRQAVRGMELAGERGQGGDVTSAENNRMTLTG